MTIESAEMTCASAKAAPDASNASSLDVPKIGARRDNARPPGDDRALGRPVTEAAASGRELDVVCLCAEWCSTCRDIHPAFQELAIEGCRFHWVDIEEHGDALESVDVETFPTIIVADKSGAVLFAGPIEPQMPKLERLVTVLGAGPLVPLEDGQWRSVVASLKTAGVVLVE